MKTKCQLVLVVLILFLASCVSSEINKTFVTAFVSAPTTLTVEIQATSTPEVTSFPTFAPTSTLPPPLPTLQLTQPPMGLLFTSFHTPYDHILHQILPSGNIAHITNAGEQKPLLSDNQRLVAFIKYISVDVQSSTSISQLWIRDREKQIEKQISPPENCDIVTDIYIVAR